MKTVIAICVYNRYENIQEWIRCWKQCEQTADLIIIHNYYGDQSQLIKFKNLCDENQIKYVPRGGGGFDIGAFQDVCRERLTNFPNDWETLLWCTDDTLPMSKTFLKPFTDKLTEGTGVVCMEISPEIKMHIRTTGFMLRKETALKLTFPADPITTKDHCYEFEHRSETSFYNQVKAMGLKVVMADTPARSPLWDSLFLKNLPRQKEHDAAFPFKNKVVFICPIFDAFPEIISSLICQTHKDWELLLLDDNPAKTTTADIIKATRDPRITYLKKERVAKWGHPLRQWALEEIKAGRLATDADYIVITNGDNYHVPIYCDLMLKGFKNGAVATYCTSMVHSYIQHGVILCRPERGYIDCAGVMVKKNVACEVGWRDVDSHSSDWTYFSDIIQKYGARNFVPVNGCLLVHN